ncbi:MAG: hypothetical protein AAF614_05330 [Chloroflexota bacterium]
MRQIFSFQFILVGLLTAVSLTLAATLTTLYDPSLNNTPDQQGFLYLTQPFPPSQATQSFGGEVTVLDTTAVQSDYAGYQGRNSHVPTLDRSNGYRLNFQFMLESESHAGSDRNGDGIDDRAGFSVIVLSSDLKGLEMGFWLDEIWAQNDDSQQAANMFTHAEGVNFATDSGLTNYSLVIRDDAYLLETNGTCLLTGPLRNYTNHAGLLDPYETPNYLFLGDNTTSARGKAHLGNVSLDTTAVHVTPQTPPMLIASPSGNNVNLSWTVAAEKYELWSSQDPYLDPTSNACGASSDCTILSNNSDVHTNALDASLNVYVVRATNSCGLVGDGWVKTAVFTFDIQ